MRWLRFRSQPPSSESSELKLGVANKGFIRIDVDVPRLQWPSEKECDDEADLGLNRSYQDMRWLSIEHIKPLIAAETAFFEGLSSPADYEDAIAARYEAADANFDAYIDDFFGLDPGVASTVAALAATGCIPFTSCNGGLAGGLHAEKNPLVGFFAKPDMLPHLIASAKAAGTGLVNDQTSGSALVVFSDRIETMQSFARKLCDLDG